ncbi:uncharacterized protein TRUGW13939_10953 [Talaromyces rugulosus]|uniref:Serine/threonine-protein kinase ATG1 n=1 Tax=Talaromyces rugulosus TaxID=121627 RepID=A0A7H8RBI0_TALRU|nr:uncharacterized protein TRUGW13939_10953 [Talaromyces rugulosus]QKX63782.1 hypothetical protein TRUGW13939_10953 [Talaromyces rugulosus]
MSTASHPNTEPLTSGTELQSDSGQTYQIEEVLADRRKPLLCVYRASAERRNYIVKNMIKGDFDYQLSLQKSLSALPNVRKVIDTVKDLGMLIYPLLSGDLFHLSQKNLSEKTRRYILQKALQGLADMHDKDVLHNDIKPNNILVDYEERPEDGIAIKTVQISDLENAVIVPPGKWLAGSLCGNAIWRSPESWCRSRQNQASDVFSFGIVV